MYEGFWCGGVGGARGLIKLMLGFTRVGRSGEVEGQWHGTYRTLIKFYFFFLFFLEISAWSTQMAVEDKAVANLRDVGMTTFQLVFGVKLKTV